MTERLHQKAEHEISENGRLLAWFCAFLGASFSSIKLTPLTGGAIQENWLVNLHDGDKSHEFVLRKDAPATILASHTRSQEFALMKLAHAAGILVPRPIALCEDTTIIGAPFAVMEKVEGTAFGPRIVKDMSLGGDRPALTRQLGAQLAQIHAIKPDGPDFAFLGSPPSNPLKAEIAALRANLDEMKLVRPALEWGFRFMEQNQPAPCMTALVHRDFRTGNIMLDNQGLVAILDWEFAGWGDPASDLGWFCASCWRFGRNEFEAGGIGTRADFYAGYESVTGQKIDDTSVRAWEIMAHLRWAVIALQQGQRHLSGAEPSLSLALTSRIVPELELAILRMTSPASWQRKTAHQPPENINPLNEPCIAGESTGADLLAIAEKTLIQSLLPKLEGSERHTGLMIASAMRMVMREITGLHKAADSRQDPHQSLQQAMRSGMHDADAHLHQALSAQTARSVSHTKPAFLLPAEHQLLQ